MLNGSDPHAALDQVIEQHRQFVLDMETVRRALAARPTPTPAQVWRLNAGIEWAVGVEDRAQVAVWDALDGYTDAAPEPLRPVDPKCS